MSTVGGEPPASDYLATRSGAFAGVKAMLVRHTVIAAVSALGTTYLVRELGPAAWGGFAVSYLLLVSVDTALTRGVIAGLLRREESAGDDETRSAARLVLYAGALSAALLAGFGVIAPLWYSPPQFTTLMLATAACALLYAARSLPSTLLERELRYRPIAVAEISDMIVFYVVAIGGVVAGHGLAAVAVATVLRGITALAVVRVARRAPLIGSRARTAARRLLPFGLPLCGVLAVSAVDGLIPSLVIGSEEAEVGFILTAAAILGYALSLVTAVGRVAVPTLARLGSDELAYATGRAVTLSTFLSLAVIVPVAGLAELWVVPLLGGSWEKGIDTVQLVAIGFCLGGATGVLGAALTATGQSRVVFRVQAIATASYLLMAVLFVLLFGTIGAVVGYAASRWVLAALLASEGRRYGIAPLSGLDVLLTGLAAYGVVVAAAAHGAVPGLAALCAAAGVWLFLWRELALVSARALGAQLAGLRLGSKA